MPNHRSSCTEWFGNDAYSHHAQAWPILLPCRFGPSSFLNTSIWQCACRWEFIPKGCQRRTPQLPRNGRYLRAIFRGDNGWYISHPRLWPLLEPSPDPYISSSYSCWVKEFRRFSESYGDWQVNWMNSSCRSASNPSYSCAALPFLCACFGGLKIQLMVWQLLDKYVVAWLIRSLLVNGDVWIRKMIKGR